MWDWFDDIGDAWSSAVDTVGGWYDSADSALGGWLPGGGTNPFAPNPDFDFGGGSLGGGLNTGIDMGGDGWQPGSFDSLTGFAGQTPNDSWSPQFNLGAIAPKDYFDVSVNTAAPAAFGSDASWMDSLASGAGKAADWMEQHPNLTGAAASVAAPLLSAALAPKPQQVKMPQFNLPSSATGAQKDPTPNHVQGVTNSSMSVEGTRPQEDAGQSAIPTRPKQTPDKMVAASAY